MLSAGGRTCLLGPWGPGEPAGRGCQPTAPALQAGAPSRICPGHPDKATTTGSGNLGSIQAECLLLCCQLHPSRCWGGGRGAWSRALCAWGWAARLQGTQKSRGLPWTAPSSPSSAASPQVVKPRRGRGTCPKSQGFLEQLGGVPRQRGGLRVSEEELGLCQHLPSGLSFQDACPLVRGPDLPTLGLQQLLLGSWPLPR